MKVIKTFNDWVEKGLISLSVLLFIIYISLILLQVVSRNYLHLPVLWAQEVAIFCFLWTIFLGAAIGLRQRRHYLVEAFPKKMEKTNHSLSLVAHVLILFFVYVLIIGGYDFARMGLTRLSNALEIPQAYLFASIPVSGLVMFLFIIELISNDLRALFRKGAD
ncbi:TRAP transporter small permease [Alteribacter keqinensis]|uniref:TRAP transporter small permease n=1 Tax=Alteribacter keqinensis TaxID=2483800 RepID=A0A3M7TX04_9BACI|nr:TRAP transporter small permease [Alteribacter keqinensis]RNA70138.1 TRAP transporter small permease [Alteribacter keqinensis]